MIKLLLLLIFFLLGAHSLKADEMPEADQEFIRELDFIKNPFESGLPQPIVVAPQPVVTPVAPPKPRKPRHHKKVKPVITLPSLDLQGVIVGGDVHQAIIDDQVVSLSGIIEGAQIISISKKGVGLLYKGKKFFLKVD